jgi:hypothetical protein
MAVRVPVYDQRTSVDAGPGPAMASGRSGVAEGLQGIGRALGNAAATAHGIDQQQREEARREEEENGRVWAASAIAKARQDLTREFVTRQNGVAPGASGFTAGLEEFSNTYEEQLLANAPTESARRFAQERMLSLRSDLGGNAMSFEEGERRRWRVETLGQATDTAAGVVAADPSSYATTLGEQLAVIDALDVPPEMRSKLRDDAIQKISKGVVLGDVERDPRGARRMLDQRLGIAPTPQGAPVRAGDPSAPRGIRNNNPGNIEAGIGWKGEIGTDGRFATFATPAHGIRALALNAVNSQRIHGNDTVNELIDRWAPPTENNTAAYAAQVAKALGVNPEDPVDLTNPETLAKFTAAVIKHENGQQPYAEADIVAGVDAALGRSTLPDAPTPTADAAMLAEGGGTTGNAAYDRLSVPEVIALRNATNAAVEREDATFRSYVSNREADDLAAYGDGQSVPQPLTQADYLRAYGDEEGSRRFAQYARSQQYAGELASLKTMPPAEIQRVLETRRPTSGGEGYRQEAARFNVLQQAAQRVLEQRAEDPIAFAAAAGLAAVQPLDLNDPQAFTAELRARVGVAATMRDKYGTGYTLLSKSEATGLAAAFQTMTAPERAKLLKDMRGALPSEKPYISIMGQVRADSPVTAGAGSIIVQKGAVVVSDRGWFSRAEAISGERVGLRILQGEDLLNPTRAQGQADGRGPAFPMPKEAELREKWVSVVGDAYRGDAQTQSAAYQMFRSFYAGEAAARGLYDGEINRDVADLAARAVTGGITEVNGAKVVMPWGMDEAAFLDSARASFTQATQQAGIALDFESAEVQTVGNGVYMLVDGMRPLTDAQGRAIQFRVDPSAPAAPVAAVPERQPGAGLLSIGGAL